MEQNGYIKLHRAVLTHPVFKDPQAWRLFCFLLLNADPKGVVRLSLRKMAETMAPAGHGARLVPTLELLASMECIEIAARRPSLVIRIPKWEKWQVNARRGHMPKSDAPTVATPPSPTVATQRSQQWLHTPSRAREESVRIDKNKKESVEKKTHTLSHTQSSSSSSQISSDPAPVQPGHSEPCAYRYPESPEEVQGEATRQGVPMTLEQARDFLEYHMAFDWTFKGSRIPPNAWRWRIRRWMTLEDGFRKNGTHPVRPGDNASPGLSAGEGFDQIGF